METKTGSFGFICKGIPGLTKSFEDFVPVFFGDPDSCILYFDHDLSIIEKSFNGYFSFIGEFNSIGQKLITT